MKLATLLKISRPRFWLYLAGTYAVGFSQGAANSSSYGWRFFFSLLFFLLPANVLLYGINDIFDEDTDAKNEKKQDKEHRLLSGEKRSLAIAVSLSFALGLLIALTEPSRIAAISIFAFLFLAYAYSAPPFRFKAKPFVDFASNILYIMPAIAGYAHASHSLPPPEALFAAFFWAMGMHLFSAIPDIAADREANLPTSAVVLGRKGALVLCVLLWGACAIFLISTGALGLAAWGALLYPLLAALPLTGRIREEKLYWYFPAINAAAGFFLYWEAAWKLLPF